MGAGAARRDIGGALFIAALLVLLFATAALLPRNSLTGTAPAQESCKGGGCLELCDQHAGANASAQCSDREMTCCPTGWASGVCAYGPECASVLDYSRYQSLEVYADTVREREPEVQADWRRFFLPMLAVVLALRLCVWMWRKKPAVARR